MKNYFLLLLKGIAMGAANVIPGVSGGTIAFITGIYDNLINSLKSFDAEAIRLLFKGKFGQLIKHVNAPFLIVLFSGALLGIVSFGKLFKWLVNYENHRYEIFVWAFFFGLIIASVFSVGRTIEKWKTSTIISFLLGTLIAISLAFMGQAGENPDAWYLILCGIIAMASMLLPGLSGSFVLMLMGNYYLIMLEAVPNRDLKVIGLVAMGAIIGFVILSRVISFFLGRFQWQTLGGLTGFILGSLLTIWPWKDVDREIMTSAGKTKEVIVGYSNWRLPNFNITDWYLVFVILLGVLVVLGMEVLGKKLGGEK